MRLETLTQKKQTLDKHRPLDPQLLKNLYEWFRIELTYTSNAIEGNTLSRNETALIVEKGITIGGKSLAEHLEATNHASALDWVYEKIKGRKESISESDILHIHSIILKGIDDQSAGHYRNVPVRISGSRVILPNPKKVPDLMKDFITWLNNEKEFHPVDMAAEAHYKLVTIHPFVDGNGRTARLLMNMILLVNEYPMAIIQKRDRLKYINSLEKAQLGGSKDDYLNLIRLSVNKSLDIYMKTISGSDTAEDEQRTLLKIGQLAKEVGETVSTIRYWTSLGLLESAEVTEANYHLYSSECLDRIKKIKSLQAKRYTLNEIKNILNEGTADHLSL